MKSPARAARWRWRARPLHVARLELVSCPDPDRAVLEMACAKGGYVRSVARDLGRALGCLGHVEALRRIEAGPFAEADAVPLTEIEADPAAHLLPVEASLVGAASRRLRRCGAPSACATATRPEVAAPDADRAWAALDGRAVALGRVEAGLFCPSRVLR